MSFVSREIVPANARLFWASVLRRAVFDYVLYEHTPSMREEWEHAKIYIFDRHLQYESGLNMEQICALFGWDPGYIRRLTKRLDRKDIKRMEMASFKDGFDFDEVRADVAFKERWDQCDASLPFYHRLLDEFTHSRPFKTVWKESDNFMPPLAVFPG